METENNEKKPGEKKKIIVSYYAGEWEVKNEGDSAVLFRSSNKEDAIKFAKDIARSHNIKIEIEDEIKKESKDEE